MENISRRTFLKTAGASALAVGAVGMLGGCGIVDNMINNILKQYADVPNAKVMNSVAVVAGSTVKTINAKGADGNKGNATAVMIDVTMLNASLTKYSLKKSNFTMKVDGADATLLVGNDAEKMLTTGYTYYYGYDMLLNSKGEATLDKFSATDTEGKYMADGYLVFKLKNPVADWKKAELTVTLGSNKAVYTITNGSTVKVTVK